MKLYNSIGPNPQVVRMFIAELGLDIETIEMDYNGRREPPRGTFKKKFFWTITNTRT